MASGDLLKQLFQSYMRRQDHEFRAAALRIIADEKQKNHHALADQLERILVNGTFSLPNGVGTGPIEDLPRDRERSTILVEVRTPRHFLQEMVLSPEVKKSVESLLREYKRGELLKTHGLRPRSKILFCGPPGCGKTLCAEVIATELGLPLLYVRFDAVISSYLGETAANLRKVFDYASRGTWVLFFDEFDAIGKSRSDSEEHSELKRVVNSFLQILDSFSSDSLVISATNHEGLLDNALWRRFDEIVYFNRPTQHQIELLLHKKLANFPHAPLDFAGLAKDLKGLAHSDVERICLDAIRECIVSGIEAVTQEMLENAVQDEKRRLRLTASAKRIKPAPTQ
jgi:SpoVK/Ycf46/Vps4 family AAA+-type ATPase